MTLDFAPTPRGMLEYVTSRRVFYVRLYDDPTVFRVVAASQEARTVSLIANGTSKPDVPVELVVDHYYGEERF